MISFFEKMAVVAATTLSWAAFAQTPSFNPPLEPNYIFGPHALRLDVANNTVSQEKGLMHVAELKDNEGMLFVFSSPKKACFWMKNTPLDLDLLFLDQDGQVLQYESLIAFDLTAKCSDFEANYALELPQGWVLRNKVSLDWKLKSLEH